MISVETQSTKGGIRRHARNRTDSAFQVPEPEVRPGDQPDFSDVKIPRAGTVPQARSRCRSPARSAISPIPSSGVLNRDGERRWVPGAGPFLTPDELLDGLKHMMTLRAFDARMQTAQRQGKTSFYMQHMGEEAVS